MKPFELRSLASDRGAPRVFLLQLPLPTTRVEATTTIVQRAALEGYVLEQAGPALASRLLRGAVPAGADLATLAQPVQLDEEAALRLILIADLIAGSRSAEKIQGIITSISRLDMTDVDFWTRKLAGPDGASARKALGVMLG